MIFLSYKSAFAGADEVQDVFNLGRVGDFLLHFGEQVFQQSCALQNDLVGTVYVVDDVAFETAPAQTHGVQSAISGGVACYHGIGQDVLCTACASTHHAIAANSAELVYKHIGRKAFIEECALQQRAADVCKILQQHEDTPPCNRPGRHLEWI